jgi:hypothetical protein
MVGGGSWAGPFAVLGSANMDFVSRQQRLPKPGESIFGRELDRVPGGKGLDQAIAAARAGEWSHSLTVTAMTISEPNSPSCSWNRAPMCEAPQVFGLFGHPVGVRFAG